MVQFNAMSMPVVVDDDERSSSSGAAAGGSGNHNMPMARCNAMAWTDETEGRLKVLVTRSDPVAGATAVTEEQAILSSG